MYLCVMARIAQPMIATAEQYQKLLVMQRSLKIEKRYSQRAEIIVLSLAGKSLEEIIERTGLSRPIVNKWRQRFRQHGLEGLKDAARSGKPSVITAKQKAMVIQKACEKPSGGYTNWCQERLAHQVGST